MVRYGQMFNLNVVAGDPGYPSIVWVLSGRSSWMQCLSWKELKFERAGQI